MPTFLGISDPQEEQRQREAEAQRQLAELLTGRPGVPGIPGVSQEPIGQFGGMTVESPLPDVPGTPAVPARPGLTTGLSPQQFLAQAAAIPDLPASAFERARRAAEGFTTPTPKPPEIDRIQIQTPQMTEPQGILADKQGNFFDLIGNQIQLPPGTQFFGKSTVTQQRTEPFRIPEQHQLVDPKDPRKGVEPIIGSPAEKLSIEPAGKTQLLRTAKKQIPLINKLLFDPNGTPNFTNIINAQGNVPKTQGHRMRSAMEVGIQGIARIETGAAMPPSDLASVRQRFMPKAADDAETIRLKWEMFQDFINGALKLVDPTDRLQGDRFNTDSIGAKIDAELLRRQSEQAAQKPAQRRFRYNPATGRIE